jgi:hypothetical protein
MGVCPGCTSRNSGMTYRTRYEKINEIGVKEAWEVAREFDPSLRSLDPADPEALREALTTLARRVRELEHEWS